MTIIDLPGGRQSYDFDCGPKALQLVMGYYNVDVPYSKLMKELKSDRDGTPVKNMIAVAERKGFQVIAETGVSIDTLKEYVDRGRPVIVLLQAWADRLIALEDWRDTDDNGHYVVVIGYEGNIIIFEDPSSFRRVWLTTEEFLLRWHDVDPRTKERYDHFAMLLLGKEPNIQKLEHMD